MTADEDIPSHKVDPLRGFEFAQDWIANSPRSRHFLPRVDESLNARMKSLESGTWHPWNADEIEEVRQFNLTFNNTAGAALLSSLADPNCLTIVTGQQPDLLASPLFVLHKALSACAWARKISSETGKIVFPIFWVASDDDDFAELKQARLVNHNGQLVDVGRRLSRGSGLSTGSPAYLWDLSDGLPQLKGDLENALAGWSQGEETSQWLSTQIEMYPNYETLFCALLTQLLGSQFPMLFVVPRLKVLRQRQTQILLNDLQHHTVVNTAINSAAARMKDMGYNVMLQRDADALNFFWVHKGRRHRLIRDKNKIRAIDPQTHSEVRRFQDGELEELLLSDPRNFAPNVVTRPVVQDKALPAALYTAGPGELAYLALLAEAYNHSGLARSAVVPRTTVTMGNFDGSRNELVKDAPALALSGGSEDTAKILKQIRKVTEDADKGLENISLLGSDLNAESHVALKKTRRHIEYGMEQLKRRLARQIAPKEWNRVARTSVLKAPAGGAQERVLAPWNFVKAGEWDALAKHLNETVDYTSNGSCTAPLPAWLIKDVT